MRRLLAAALLAVSAACVPHRPPMSAGQLAVASDPPRNTAHPARNRQLVIPSGPAHPSLGRPAEMNALMMVAAGAGPHPTLLLLHGLPGNERNLDLAQAARRAGWNVLTFTYRGAWGSEGTFSIQHAVDDTRAALTWLRSDVAARDFAVDPGRIVIAGHSMGGYMAAHIATFDSETRRRCDRSAAPPAPPGVVVADQYRFCPQSLPPPLAGLVLLDAWDIASTARWLKAGGAEARTQFIASMDDIGRSLGSITAADLADNLIRRGEDWNLAALAPQLARLPMLTVYATHGGGVENKALFDAIDQACPPTDTLTCAPIQAVELDSDHAFADKRVELARTVVDWLYALPPTT